MFIWQGLGWLVLVIGFASLLLTEFVFEWFMDDENFYQDHSWCPFLGLMIGALLIWCLSWSLGEQRVRFVRDEETGERFALRNNEHSFMFIPLRYCPIAMAALAIIFLLFK